MTSPVRAVRRALPVLVLALVLIAATPLPGAIAATSWGGPQDCADAGAFSPAYGACESRNLAMTGQNVVGSPEITPGLAAATAAYQLARRQAIAADPEREPDLNTCTTAALCPIDPRMSGWTDRGGLVSPVLYTSRSGGTLSGHVWATTAGPAKRPAIVITNGSIVGFEETYWYLAQSLAKAGFVVMTFDVQGEGMSDQFGEAPDRLEDAFAGTPFLGLFGPRAVSVDVFGGNGYPFYDGTQDTLDFLLSTPTQQYVPRPSRTTATSHAGKQDRRVQAGLNPAYNPLWSMVDPSRVGLTGHSYGAEAASWLAQKDPRVDTAVALDSLCVPAVPQDEAVSLGSPSPDFNGAPYLTYGLSKNCFSSPSGPVPAVTKPVLGISADYLFVPTAYPLPPNPLGKSRASLAYSAAGVDTGQILIRGGTHLSFVDLPVLLPGSLRAIDMITWYTTAWFAKYLQHRPGADAMLLTKRWQDDPTTSRLDTGDDPSLFSWHFRSRLDITGENGGAISCENLRRGCASMTPKSGDGWSGDYSMLAATR